MQAYYDYNSSGNYAAIVQFNGVNKLKDLFFRIRILFQFKCLFLCFSLCARAARCLYSGVTACGANCDHN